MSYMRCHGDNRFYAFKDSETNLLEIFPRKDVAWAERGCVLTLEEAKQLKTIVDKYIEESEKVE